MRNHGLVGIVALAAALCVTASGEREAAACGGCIPASMNVSNLTAERMIFSISKTQSTLWDEITFSGAPSSFAWILPIRGIAEVGLSADIFFSTIDNLTATIVNQPPLPCSFGSGGGSAGDSGAGSSGGGDGGGSGGTVTVLASATVGPYEMVQLASKDGSALYDWLKKNGFSVPAADQPVIGDYVKAGMNFLAMKLVPGKGVQSMQPVRVTTKGAFPVLPLHMVSVGTGRITGITLWIFAEGRWEPQNAPFFTITDDDLTWDWSASSSNYETVRTEKEKALGNAGWLIESSLDLSMETLSNTLLANVQNGDTIGGGSGFSSGSGSGGDSGPGGEEGGVGGYAPPPDGGLEGGMDAAANDDLAILYNGISGSNVRITRLRTDIAHKALSKDLIIQASPDQSELSNQLTPAHQINLPCGDDGGSSGGSGGGGPGDTRGAGASNGSATAEADQGGGCSTTAAQPTTQDVALVTVAGFIGIAAVRTRRKQRRRR